MTVPTNPGNGNPGDGFEPYGNDPNALYAQNAGQAAPNMAGAGDGGDATDSKSALVSGGGPSPLVWIIGALAAAVVLIGGFIFFGSSSGDDSNNTPPPPAAVAVPSVLGFTIEEGTKSIEGSGLIVGEIVEMPSDQPNGTILEQNPTSGTQVVQGSPVDLVVAGTAMPIVPDVESLKQQEAVNALIAAGLTEGKVKKVNSPEPAGEVLAQFPKAGTTVEPGSAVNLTISNGKTGVPDVVGMSQAEAEANLANAGFKYVVQEIEAQDKVGLVVQMNPKAGAKAKVGATVTITVVKAAAPIPTPTPTPTPKPTPTPTPTPNPTNPVGGKAKCDLATFTKFVEGKLQGTGVPLQEISDFKCEDGWAVVTALVGEPGTPVLKRYILEAEGQFWVQRKSEDACAPGSPLPNSLRPMACEPLVG